MSDLRELLERLRNAPDEEALVAIDEAITVLRRVVCRWCGEIQTDHQVFISRGPEVVLKMACKATNRVFEPMEARND